MLSACVPFALIRTMPSDARDALARNDNDLVGVCGFRAAGATPQTKNAGRTLHRRHQ
jgi:hypothetical protein